MRIVFLFTALFLIGFVQPSEFARTIKPLEEVSRAHRGFEIHRARLKGGKLIVTGHDFDEGAVVLINNEVMKTIRDPDSPSSRLIAKRASDAIPIETFYVVAVRNSNGEQEYLRNFRGSFFNARVLPTSMDRYSVVEVQVGEYVLAYDSDRMNAISIRIDPNYLQRVRDFALPSIDYVLFQAIQSGVTDFRVVIYYGGDAPPYPFYNVEITIT